MANEQNLIQNQGLSRKQVEETNRKGGINSGKARARKKIEREKEKKERERIADTIRTMMASETPQSLANKIKSQTGLDASTMQSALIASIFMTGMKKGDPKVLELIAKYLGEEPTPNVDVNVNMSNPYDGLTVDELRKLAEKYGEDS